MTMTDPDYWLQRYATAIENAVDAPGEPSRSAYLDLADHYWSMHVMSGGLPASSRRRCHERHADALVMHWAA